MMSDHVKTESDLGRNEMSNRQANPVTHIHIRLSTPVTVKPMQS